MGGPRDCRWEQKTVQPLGKTVWQLLKRLNTDLPPDPAATILGRDPRAAKMHVRTKSARQCVQGALPVRARNRKPPTRPWMGDGQTAVRPHDGVSPSPEKGGMNVLHGKSESHRARWEEPQGRSTQDRQVSAVVAQGCGRRAPGEKRVRPGPLWGCVSAPRQTVAVSACSCVRHTATVWRPQSPNLRDALVRRKPVGK